MGVRTALGTITFVAAATAEGNGGEDIKGLLAECQQQCAELINTLNYLVNDILTPTGLEAANIATINAQIAALS
jgi:hypothetical protein